MPAKHLEVLHDGADAQLEAARRRGSLAHDEPIEQEIPAELLPIDPFPIGEDGNDIRGIEVLPVPEPGVRAAQNIFELGFDRTNPAAQAWAANRSSTMIQLTAAETRRAVRAMINGIIEDGFRLGIPPLKLARQIRPLVGLTWNHQRAVRNLRARLLDPANRGKTVRAFSGKMKWKVPPRGMPSALVDARVNRYAKRLNRWRANNIARTETLMSSNEGQRQLWAQAQRNGDLPLDVKREWIITPDTRLCSICQPMRGQVRGITEMFVTGNGDFVIGPPAHPSCRCAAGITRKAGTGTNPTTAPRRRGTRPRGPRGRPRRTPSPRPPVAEPPPPAAAPRPGGGATVVDIGPRPGPLATPGRRYSFTDFGATRPRALERRELLDGALNQALDSLPPRLRQRYIEVLEQLDFKWKVATPSTDTLGAWGRMKSVITPRSASTGQGPMPRQLQLQLSRRNEAYTGWIKKQADEFKAFRGQFASGEIADNAAFQEALEVWRAANPRPEVWRLANKDEVAEVIVHELSHGIDVVAGTSRENWYGLTKLWNADDMQTVWWQDGYWGGKADVIKTLDPRFADGFGRPLVKPHAGAIADSRFSYGAKKPTEGFAEAMRLYFTGDTGGLATGTQMTAAEFRTQYPRIAEWIERVIING